MGDIERVVIGDCVLYRGDCRTVLPLLGPVDAVVMDPPYGVGLKGKRALRHGTVQTFRPGHYGHPDTLEYVVSVVLPSLEWCRKIAGCVVVTPGIRHCWQYPAPDDLGCFFSASGTGMGRWGFTCSQPILFYGKDPYLTHNLGSRPNSCGQTYPNDANAIDHPCAKPLPMWRWLVNRVSLEGMTVLDPMMGAGTTGVACVELRRKFIGIELQVEYFDLACRRIEQAYTQLRLPLVERAQPVQQALIEVR